MSLSRAAIVDQLKEIVGADRVITDETVLKKNSIDRFRKFPDIHGIYTLPIPAAVVKLGSTEQVSRVLNFMNAHKINGVPRTGASATEGGLETVVENSVVLDGSAMNQIINIDIENMQATAALTAENAPWCNLFHATRFPALPAEHITVGQVCAESERSNAAVKTVKR